MVDRQRKQSDAKNDVEDRRGPGSAKVSMNTLRQDLEIDREGLDDCLVKQPELFFHASDAYVVAVASRDQLKLDLEEKMAQLDEQVRKEAIANDEKLSETAVAKRVQASPELKELQSDYLAAKAEADKWLALKEAFQQRSYMLRELVSLAVSRMRDRDSYAAPGEKPRTLADHQAEDIRRRTGELRSERRGRAR